MQKCEVSIKNCRQQKSICDGRIFVERPAGTNALLKILAEDNICRLIINVKPELKMIRDFAADCWSVSPAIANTHVGCSIILFVRKPQFRLPYFPISFVAFEYN